MGAGRVFSHVWTAAEMGFCFTWGGFGARVDEETVAGSIVLGGFWCGVVCGMW